jgi:NAD(P)H-hydrate epimerase
MSERARAQVAGYAAPPLEGRAALELAVLSVAQMADVGRIAAGAGMPRETRVRTAGRAIAREIARRWSARPVIVLCGPHGTGEVGHAVAAVLVDAGWPVRLAAVPRPAGAAAAVAAAGAWAGTVEVLEPAALEGAELVVDALFGTGLRRALEGNVARTLAAAATTGRPLVAVDLPSGLAADTGAHFGAVRTQLTVALCSKKPAHLLLPGRGYCGEVVVASLGVPAAMLAAVGELAYENHPDLWLAALPRPAEDANKYSRGHALVAGGFPVTGAARLAARGAARAGAGLVTVAVPHAALAVYVASLTSVMVSALPRPEDIDRLLADRRISGLLVGPGAGVGAPTRQRARAMLATQKPTVLDADALSSFKDDTAALRHAITGPCVLTPHEREFARLFHFAGDKLTRARRAAREMAAVVVLKGSDTVITAPDGHAILNANAPPTLATAGAGDVLSGIVVGLLAQGMEPFLAAAAAVWLHGAAAASFGPGLIAEDLPDLLPGVLRRLYARTEEAPLLP